MGVYLKRSKVRSVLRKAAKSRRAKAKAPALPKRGMNANEARFNRQILGGEGLYEVVSFDLTRVKGRKYTPDFSLRKGEALIAIIEVKGSYKLYSEDRARLAWEIVAERVPGVVDGSKVVFVWARFSRGGYDCEAWYDCGRVILKRRVTSREEFDRFLQDGVSGELMQEVAI
jgi:hypothetical protein